MLGPLRLPSGRVADEADIWRAAGLMFRHYGSGAQPQVDRLAAYLEEKGNQFGAAAWRSVGAALEELLRAPETSDRRH